MKALLKFVKSLLKRLKELKFINYFISNLEYLDYNIHLLIERDTFTENSTIGELFLNDEFMSDTLELPWRNNERSISCIPEGFYEVRLRTARESATRDYLHLLVKNVPSRDYILFHKGNYPSDTKGCILVGLSREHDKVNNSSLAMDLLMKEIIKLGGENICLTIKNKKS